MPNRAQDKGYQAFRILQFVFVAAPIIVGFDKFFNFLTVWPDYLSPLARQIFGTGHTFMAVVGIVEIAVGICVIFKPSIFGYVISFWLLLIIVNLLFAGRHYDVALRDFGLMLAAFSLGKLGEQYG